MSPQHPRSSSHQTSINLIHLGWCYKHPLNRKSWQITVSGRSWSWGEFMPTQLYICPGAYTHVKTLSMWRYIRKHTYLHYWKRQKNSKSTSSSGWIRQMPNTASACALKHSTHEPTWVTFSVTWCVRSMSLQGAMMSISPVGSAMSGSGLKSTKLRVIWGILEMVRYRMRSESDVEFNMLDLLFTAPVDTPIHKHRHTHTHTQSKWLGKNQRG